VFIEVSDHPKVKILNVSDGVHYTARAKDVSVFRVESARDDSSLVFPHLEMRIGKADEDFRNLPLEEKVWQEFHRVGPDAADILVGPKITILSPHGLDSFPHELGHLVANFKTYSVHPVRGYTSMIVGMH
jgi:hypothetical protein